MEGNSNLAYVDESGNELHIGGKESKIETQTIPPISFNNQENQTLRKIVLFLTLILFAISAALICFIVMYVQKRNAIEDIVETDTGDLYEMPSFDFMGQVKKHPCDRRCNENDQGKLCHYVFVVELHSTLGKACWECPENISNCYLPHCVQADGVERGIITVNRSMPGPEIAVCKDDVVMVDVINTLATETTSMHFHGEHFRNHQYFDGTPGVTQCPISPGAMFRYKFKADVAGSMFYHSHTSFQRGDGLFGPYIVRNMDHLDPSTKEYDFDLTEHFISVQEWFHKATREAFVLHHWDVGKNKADNILINGRGRINLNKQDNNQAIKSMNEMPLATFFVNNGFRYRFRIVSPGFTLCPILVSIENHTMTIIASDTSSVKPLPVQSLIIHPGERYDFVINANQTAGFYRMSFAGLFDCANLKAHGEAILIYNETNTTVDNYELIRNASLSKDPSYDEVIMERLPLLGPLNYAPYSNNNRDQKNGYIPITQLNLTESNEASRALSKIVPDKTFYLAYDLNKRDNPHFHHPNYYPFNFSAPGYKFVTAQINNISLKLPASPLLSQPSKDSRFCNAEAFSKANKDCGEEWCECIHRIKVDQDDVVEIFLIDQGFAYDVSHPWHLHGYSFYVIAMERHGKNNSHVGPLPFKGNSISKQEVIDLNNSGKIKRNLVDPPLKDTVSVPDAGFTLIRFQANNPGYWLLHCHMSWHNHVGMALVLQVGESDQRESNTIPKGFPTCGNFVGG